MSSTTVGKRTRPKPLVPGKTAPVDAPTVAELRRARAAFELAKRDLTNVTRRAERQLGDAEIGVCDGREVIRREQSLTGGKYVRRNWRDDLRLLDGRPVAPYLAVVPDPSAARLAGGEMP